MTGTSLVELEGIYVYEKGSGGRMVPVSEVAGMSGDTGLCREALSQDEDTSSVTKF